MRSLVCCVVVCALFVPVPAVSATPLTLFSTLGPGDSFASSGGRTIGGSDAATVAAKFTPSVTASLASIELATLNLINAGTNSLEISLCNDSAGEPDCALALELLTLSGLTKTASVHSVDSVAKPMLTAGTPYWLVVAATNPATDRVGWRRNSEDLRCDVAFWRGADLDPSWSVNREETALAFRVVGTTDTPIVNEGGILNIASYALPGVPFYGIAQGSMFVVFGYAMGPTELQMSSLPRPPEWADTSVQVSVGGTTVDAFLVYTSAYQLAAILPSSTPTGEGTLTVTYDGQTSAPVSIRVVQSAPGIFTWNQAGFGPGVIQNWVSPTETPTNSLVEAAAPGQTEVLWATGLGPIDAPDNDIAPVGDLPVNVEVLVGNQSVTPAYAGRSPQLPGIDQVNFVLPADIEGCRVPVALKVDGAVSNYVTMSISKTGSTCSDPTDFSAEDLEKVVQNDGASIGVIGLMRGRGKFVTPLGEVPVNMDQVRGALYQRDMRQIVSGPGVRENDLQATFPSLGSCMVSSFRSGDLVFHPTDPVPFLPLDGGPMLTITSALDDEREIGGPMPGIYGAMLGGGLPNMGEVMPDYLEAGQYNVANGQGGAAIGPFEAAVGIVSPLIWTNEANISEIPRSQDLLITWTPGDPNTEFLVIMGTSDDVTSGTSTSFVCSARIDAGMFTVPSTVLSSLNPNTPWTFEGLPTGVLFVGTAPIGSKAKFEAQGLDIGYVHYSNWFFKNVDYQ